MSYEQVARQYTKENVSDQSKTVYEDYKKIKKFEDVGHFLTDYVVDGGEVTKDELRNDTINASNIVASFNNNVLTREGHSFATKIPNAIYYLDFTKEGDWHWGTSHVGVHSEDYIPVSVVTTNSSGLVNTINDARGHVGGFRLKDEYGLEGYAKQQYVDEQLADIVDIPVSNFKLPEEDTYDEAIYRAIDSAAGREPIRLTFPRGNVKLNHVVTRKRNLTISAYGTTFIATNNTDWMWTHYGDFFVVEGCDVVANDTDTYRGFKILNDAETPLSNYANFRDVRMDDLYQALDFYCESGLGGAAYRHKLNNVRVRNWTNPKTRAGSFGLRMGGNAEGDAAGNDSKLLDVFVKGYEKNIIIQKSVGTKLTQCGIDGGAVALELDGGSYISLVQCYVEYNDTFINAVNSPYRPMLLSTTVANYTTYVSGNLYNNEDVIDYGASSPVLIRQKRMVGSSEYNLVRAMSGHGAGLRVDNTGKALDFMRIGTKHVLIPSQDIDLYEDIPAGYKRFYGRHSGSEFSTIDERGYVKYLNHAPVNGKLSFTDGDTTPAIDKSNIYEVNNTVSTEITRFDNGVVGHEFTLIAKSDMTVIKHNANIILKGGVDRALANEEVIKFICSDAPTWSACVHYEI